ncbi:MAG: hypothetical protein ACLQO1_03650 [Steroidobacteraceae bacterium]
MSGQLARTIVLKFGSSVLRDLADIPSAVHEIYRWYRDGYRVLAVVSALGAQTNALLAEAQELCADPDEFATAELLATGERRSAALLGIGLDRAGVPARVIDPRTIGLVATGRALASDPVAVNKGHVQLLFDTAPVLVLPGFFAYDGEGRVALLGRGGSDLSAAFLHVALGAERCRLLKDVDGVYEKDPAVTGTTTQRFAALPYDKALKIAAPLIQPKAVEYLARNSRPAEVAALGLPYETRVHAQGETISPCGSCPALRIVLLGLGHVGGGVFERLKRIPEHFTLLGALVRHPVKYGSLDAPADFVTADAEALLAQSPDVVVELLPGLEPAQSLIERARNQGAHIVSANKQVVNARRGGEASVAVTCGSEMLFSAAVGGSAPMIEAVRRAARERPVLSLAGVLNGTCNVILDRWSAGHSLAEALAEAKRRGFAEADPSEDISGRDTARKLSILARAAFRQELALTGVQALTEEALSTFAGARDEGRVIRLVARAQRLKVEETRVATGIVQLEALPASHPFAQTRAEWNTLLIETEDHRTERVTGRGAGRWPTTEAVMADLFEIRRRMILG